MIRDSSICRSISLQAAPERLRDIREFMDEVAREASLDEERAFDLKVAVSEACANAVEHSGSDQIPLDICASVLSDRVVVEISDGGDFRLRPGGPERATERGLGLPLMVALMDEVRFFKSRDGGTTVALSLFLEGASAATAAAG